MIILTGAGDKAFCSGGDQKIRGDGGYVGERRHVGRLNVLDLQVQIRRLPKPVIAMVAGYAIGGGHVLHVVLRPDHRRRQRPVFGQTGPKVGSFDGGYGSWLLAAIVGQKKAREIWYLCRQYDAQEALDMGLVNTVVPLAAAGGGDGRVVPARCWTSRRWRCACSRAPSTRRPTAPPACSSSPATPRCSTT